MDKHLIRISGIIEESYTDGVGIRFSVFTQGCAHNCPGCQNPNTHDFKGGCLVTIESIVDKVLSNPMLDGITLTGGDPLYQVDACIELCKQLKEKSPAMTVWCYTGFTWEEILGNPEQRKLLNYIDILVDGPYLESKRQLSLRFRGSSNQRIIDVKQSLEYGEVKIFIDD